MTKEQEFFQAVEKLYLEHQHCENDDCSIIGDLKELLDKAKAN